MKNFFFHIGGMRTGSTFLQQAFSECSDILDLTKHRYFTFQEYFKKEDYFRYNNIDGDEEKTIIDSDENYSLGRFKEKMISYKDEDFNLKKELHFINHDIEKSIKLLSKAVPDAKVIFILRNQKTWLESIYRHDIYHFAVHDKPEHFFKKGFGNCYFAPGKYNDMYNLLLKYFNKKNIGVFLFEEMKYNSEMYFNKLNSFLGVDVNFTNVKHSSRNTLPNPSQLRLLRKINFLSQRRANKKENRLYFYARSIVLKNKLSFFNQNNLINFDELGDWLTVFETQNEFLSKQISLQDEMFKYNYFNLIKK